MQGKIAIDNITRSYLNLQTPKENRGNVITFLIVFLDVIGLLPILGEPFSYNYFIAAIIPAGIIHIWAILYIVAPYKFERSYYLFMGCYAVVNTYIYFLVSQKLIYLHIGVTSKTPFVIGFVFFIGLIIFMNWLNIKALYSGTYDLLQKKNSINMQWLSIGTIGYLIGQSILTFVYSESIQMMIIVICVSLLSVILSYFSIFIHRYFFILKNIDAVKQLRPMFGLPKKERDRMLEELRKNRKGKRKKRRNK